jgi:hypothetical protein
MLRLRLSYLVVRAKCGLFRIIAIQKPKFLQNFLRIQTGNAGLLKNVLNNACAVYEKN